MSIERTYNGRGNNLEILPSEANSKKLEIQVAACRDRKIKTITVTGSEQKGELEQPHAKVN